MLGVYCRMDCLLAVTQRELGQSSYVYCFKAELRQRCSPFSLAVGVALFTQTLADSSQGYSLQDICM